MWEVLHEQFGVSIQHGCFKDTAHCQLHEKWKQRIKTAAVSIWKIYKKKSVLSGS